MIDNNAIATFSDLLMRWGRVHNLVGSTDYDSIKRNVNDSMLPISFLQPFDTCIDIGSGAGFPALILACFYPSSFFYLLEPRSKRVSFLNYALINMKLKNAKVIAKYSYDVYDIKADLISSRAVCRADKLIEQSRHLLNNGGRYLLFKGSDSERESHILNDFDSQIIKYDKRVFIYAKEKPKP